jgi:hypothetical protein
MPKQTLIYLLGIIWTGILWFLSTKAVVPAVCERLSKRFGVQVMVIRPHKRRRGLYVVGTDSWWKRQWIGLLFHIVATLPLLLLYFGGIAAISWLLSSPYGVYAE